MKKLIPFLSFLAALFLYIGLTPDKASAAVDPNDVNSVLNGKITQQSINQTKKPQFAEREGTSEMIDPSSGKLVWRETEISLEGRDGLDLDIGVMYDSNNSFTYMRNYGVSGNLKKYNYLNSRYDLGAGWSFQFPSIQLADGYYYYHTGDGAVYQIDFYLTDTFGSLTHLVGYQGKDMRMYRDTSSLFSNGQVTSAYYLEYVDKKREYFASDGRLLGIVDRYGNKITFQHIDRTGYDGVTNKVISSITDSVGRVVTFAYDTTLQTTGTFNGEGITVAVKDLTGAVKQSVTFMKWRSASTLNGNPDGYAPYLYSIQNQNGEKTYFGYTVATGNFDYYKKAYDSYSGYNSYFSMTKVYYPTSVTTYQYEKTNRNLGASGLGEDIRVNARFDQMYKYSASTGTNQAFGDLNHLDYVYTGDYTGYPAYTDPNNLPSSFTYTSTNIVRSSTATAGLTTISVLNGIGQTLSVETRAANGEKKIIRNVSFHSSYTSKPTRVQTEDYAIGDTAATANILISDTQYTDWGEIASETAPLTQAQINDSVIKARYTKSYTYDPTYHFTKTKSYYQNNSTLLTESYEYYSDGRLRSYRNAKNEATDYCYASVNGSTNCTDPNAAVTGNIAKVKTTKNLGNGKTAVNETYYAADTNYAYPSETREYITTLNSGGQTVTQTIINTKSYDMGTGLVLQEKDGNGRTTIYHYDALGRVDRTDLPTFTNANGIKYDVSDQYTYQNNYYSYNYDLENEGLISFAVRSKRVYTRKSDGATTTVSDQWEYYDPFGQLRIQQTWDPDKGQYQNYQYHNDDMLRVNYSIDPLGNVSTVSYDAWGNQKESTDAFNNLYVTERDIKARKRTSYFVAANQVAAYRVTPSSASLKSNYYEEFEDQWGQLLSVKTYKDWPTASQPITESYTYDLAGNIIGHIDPKRNLNNEGYTSVYSYDVLNRLTSVKDALGQITKYQYDGNGQLSAITVQKNETDTPQLLRSVEYTENGQVAWKTDASGNRTTYGYNNLGLLDWNTDRNEVKFQNQYDEQQRATSTLATGANGTSQFKNIYGSNGILTKRDEKYVNNAFHSSVDTLTDVLSRTKSVVVNTAGYSSTTNLYYDLSNQITSVVSNGYSTNFKYSGGRLDRVQTDNLLTNNDAVGANVKYGYYPDGQIKSITYPPLKDGSLLVTENAYDALNRLVTVTNKKGSSILSSFTYGYDDNDNIISITRTIAGQASRTDSYTYDKLNRLLTITRWDGNSAAYSYDLKGNRLTRSDTSPAATNTDEVSYAYDLNNTLTGVTKGGVSTTFEYGPDGHRIKKTSGGAATQYRYDTNGQVIAEMSGSSTTATYVRGDRLLVKKSLQGAQDYYYLYNGHGDVVQMVDTNGQIVNSYSYDEWGNIAQQTEQVSNIFKYSGEVYDAETGLYNLRARYYDPSVGRFINEDTYEGQIDNPLSLNAYTYVHNNPLIYADPTGHFLFATALVGAAIGGVIGAAANIYHQVAVEKKSFSSLNYKELAISTGAGMVTGALAGSGLGVVSMAAISGGVNAASTYATNKVNHQSTSAKSLGVSFAVGAAGGFLGGSGALASSSVKNSTKTLANLQFKEAMGATWTQSGQAINKAVLTDTAKKAATSGAVKAVAGAAITNYSDIYKSVKPVVTSSKPATTSKASSNTASVSSSKNKGK